MAFAHTESALVLIGIFVYLCTKLAHKDMTLNQWEWV